MMLILVGLVPGAFALDISHDAARLKADRGRGPQTGRTNIGGRWPRTAKMTTNEAVVELTRL